MASPDDFDQLLRWSERLRLYAQIQGMYLEQLLEHGFDQEQAYSLVRDWSGRTLGWATDMREEPPWIIPGGLVGGLDPSGVAPDESWLIDPEQLDDAAQPAPPGRPSAPPNVIRMERWGPEHELTSLDDDDDVSAEEAA